MITKRIIGALAALALVASPAVAQQIQPGQILGNPSGARAPASPTTLSAILGLTTNCATRGAVPFRGASALECLAPGTAGLPLLTGGAGANPAYGILAMAAGGSGANLTASNGGLIYSGASAMAVLAGTATAGQIPRSGANAAPSWSTATYPATVGVSQVLYASSANVIGGLATGNNGVLVTSAGGVPSISSTLPNAVQDNITRLGTVTVGVWNGTAVPAANGGTGQTVYVIGDLLQASTTSALSRLAAVATGNVLLSGGVGTVSSWGKVALTAMATQANQTMLANVSGGAAVPSALTWTQWLDSVCGGTQGMVAYRGASTWGCLAVGSSGQVLTSGGPAANISWTTAAGSGTVTSVIIAAGNGISVSGTCTITITGTCTVAADLATNSQGWSATANKMIDAARLNGLENPVTLTDAATVALDMATFKNGFLTIGGNRALGNPTNTQTGRCGYILIQQDGTGSRTLSYGSSWKFVNQVAPVLSTAISAVDVLNYCVYNSTFIFASMMNNVK